MSASNASRWLLRALAVIVLAAAAAFAWKATRPAPVAVVLATAEPGRVETTVANTRAGSVSACRRAKLATPLGGRIEKLTVREGDRVKKGQLLLELWNDDLLARERVSREQLQHRAGSPCAKPACSPTSRCATRRARASCATRASFRRTASTAPRARRRRKQAGCESARTQVEEAEARISASRADTARTVMRAPFDGIVAEVNGEVGEYLTPSPPGIPTLPAVDLIDDSCLYVSAPIDEVDAAQLKVGMAGRITLDAYRGQHFAGKLRRIAPYVLALEKQARTVEVEVEFDSPGEARHLLVGYSADIEIVVAARDGVVRMPTAALMPGNRVLVLRRRRGAAKSAASKPGSPTGSSPRSRSGLKQGDRVVTSLERAGVKAGARAVEEAKAAAAPGK